MKNYLDLSDDQVLDEVGNFGPGVVGTYLFERAEWIREKNPGGLLGPGMVGRYEPSVAAQDDLVARGMLMVAEVDFVEDEASAVAEDLAPVIEAPVKRGPGRPRKNA